jgi:hypothetical protein
MDAMYARLCLQSHTVNTLISLPVYEPIGFPPDMVTSLKARLIGKSLSAANGSIVFPKLLNWNQLLSEIPERTSAISQPKRVMFQPLCPHSARAVGEISGFAREPGLLLGQRALYAAPAKWRVS